MHDAFRQQNTRFGIREASATIGYFPGRCGTPPYVGHYAVILDQLQCEARPPASGEGGRGAERGWSGRVRQRQTTLQSKLKNV